MYKEEKMIDSILHYKNSPNDEFKAYTAKELSQRIKYLKSQIYNLETEFEIKLNQLENTKSMNNKQEELAKYIHDENWSGWMGYLFSKCLIGVEEEGQEGCLVIPKWAVDRWKCQMNTKYENLTKEEKAADLKEANRILEIINRRLNETNKIYRKIKSKNQ